MNENRRGRDVPWCRRDPLRVLRSGGMRCRCRSRPWQGSWRGHGRRRCRPGRASTRTVKEPLGPVVLRDPWKICEPFFVIRTCQFWPTTLESTSYSTSILPLSGLSFSFQSLAPLQEPRLHVVAALGRSRPRRRRASGRAWRPWPPARSCRTSGIPPRALGRSVRPPRSRFVAAWSWSQRDDGPGTCRLQNVREPSQLIAGSPCSRRSRRYGPAARDPRDRRLTHATSPYGPSAASRRRSARRRRTGRAATPAPRDHVLDARSARAAVPPSRLGRPSLHSPAAPGAMAALLHAIGRRRRGR